MKFFFLALISFQALATKTLFVDHVERAKVGKENISYKLNNTEWPFTMSKNNSVVPCLENASKAKMPVEVIIDKEAHLILECKLFSGLGGEGTRKK